MDNKILPEHLPYEIQKQNINRRIALSLSSVEKKHIEKVFLHTKGNKAKAARDIDIGLTTLIEKLKNTRLTGKTADFSF